MKPQEERKCFSIQKVRAWGANIDEAMPRCLNNETFYLTLVGKALQDSSFEKLRDAVQAGDLDTAFDAAHSLKGMMLNLSLTPLSIPVEKMTELLRARTDTDYAPLLAEIAAQRESLQKLAED